MEKEEKKKQKNLEKIRKNLFWLGLIFSTGWWILVLLVFLGIVLFFLAGLLFGP